MFLWDVMLLCLIWCWWMFMAMDCLLHMVLLAVCLEPLVLLAVCLGLDPFWLFAWGYWWVWMFSYPDYIVVSVMDVTLLKTVDQGSFRAFSPSFWLKCYYCSHFFVVNVMWWNCCLTDIEQILHTTIETDIEQIMILILILCLIWCQIGQRVIGSDEHTFWA